MLQGIAPYVGLNFAVYESLKGMLLEYELCIIIIIPGYVMSYLTRLNDTRDQIILDNEFPIIAKLMCGATSGGIAQSSMSLLFVIEFYSLIFSNLSIGCYQTAHANERNNAKRISIPQYSTCYNHNTQY